MKYRIALAVSLFALSAGSYATTLCQEKEQNILKEISYAEKHQNQNRIDGLNKALSEVRANCSDSQLRADHQKKIAKQKDEVAERQQDLAEAKQKGDADRVGRDARWPGPDAGCARLYGAVRCGLCRCAGQGKQSGMENCRL